ADDARADVTLLTFCSRTRPSLVLQEAIVVVDRDCEMTHAAIVDTEEIPGDWADREAHPSVILAPTGDGMLRRRSHGDLSTCGIPYLTELTPGEGVTREFSHARIGPLTPTSSIPARAGVRYRLRRIVSLVPQTSHNEPHIHAIRLLQQGQRIGF